MKLSFGKALAAEMTLVALLVLGYFSADIYAALKQQNISYTPALECELNQKSCAVALKDGSILETSMEPKIILPLQKAEFIVKNIGAKEVKAVIRGLNMEMGVHEYKFQKQQDGTFRASVLLPSCSIDMKWQVDVFVSKNSGEYGGGFITWSKNRP
ncbi:MAG: hypothetical protein AB7D29_06600 [Campylobacterales bacterium]